MSHYDIPLLSKRPPFAHCPPECARPGRLSRRDSATKPKVARNLGSALSSACAPCTGLLGTIGHEKNPSSKSLELLRWSDSVMKKKNVLFICIHNSARSQMAEAFLNEICADQFEAHSAGIEPGSLNPIVIEAMQEVGIDISSKATKSVSDMLKSGMTFACVITVCDETSAERCPVFPGVNTRLHWSFLDPSGFPGAREEKLARTREVRDTIKAKVEQWCAEICSAIAA